MTVKEFKKFLSEENRQKRLNEFIKNGGKNEKSTTEY
jgi:hypothetical protein